MRTKEPFANTVPRVLLIVMAILMIIAGILLKQPQSVLNKAIRICLECIGIG